jgi:hypothetical protein
MGDEIEKAVQKATLAAENFSILVASIIQEERLRSIIS